LALDNLGNALVELVDVDGFAGVGLLHVGRDAEVPVLGFDVGSGDHVAEVRLLGLGGMGIVDAPDVGVGELVLVAFVHEIGRSIDEGDAVVGLVLLEDDDAGGDARAKKRLGGSWMTVST